MLYNPSFFEGLTDLEKKDVLKHEFYHIVLMHVTDRLPDPTDEKARKLWNIATDLAINSHLSNLPAGCLMPGEINTPFENTPPGKSAEWYMKNMPPLPTGKGKGEGKGEPGDGKEKGDPGEAQGDGEEGDAPDSFDDHSGWGDVTEETRNIAKERLKDIIKKAAEESAKANNWGSISASTRAEIMKGIQHKLNWKKVLRYFIKTSQKANKKASIRRINKRYSYIHPGKKSERVASVAISIAEFTVVPFDTDVAEDKVFVWRKGEQRMWERVSCGGTCFDAPTNWVNRRPFDGHIILTDMEAPKPVASKPQRMWITTEYYANRPYFSTNERIIAIPESDME